MNTRVAKRKVLVASQSHPVAVYSSLVGTIVFALVLFYMYFLSMSVVHVVMRKELNQQSRVLESQIATLEATYIEAQHLVSERIAQAETLSETSEKIFVTRISPSLALSNAN